MRDYTVERSTVGLATSPRKDNAQQRKSNPSDDAGAVVYGYLRYATANDAMHSFFDYNSKRSASWQHLI
jgi:hypothetical protein